MLVKEGEINDGYIMELAGPGSEHEQQEQGTAVRWVIRLRAQSF